MKSKKPFIGIEIEGPETGIETLFIPKGSSGLISPKTFLQFKRFYFGAGDQRNITINDMAVISQLIRFHKNIIIEFDDLSQIRNLPESVRTQVKIVLVLNLNDINAIKIITNENLYWLNFKLEKNNDFQIYNYKTSLNDKRYENDKGIE